MPVVYAGEPPGRSKAEALDVSPKIPPTSTVVSRQVRRPAWGIGAVRRALQTFFFQQEVDACDGLKPQGKSAKRPVR